MSTTLCPNGHQSTDPDWCDTCGAKLSGGPSAPPPPSGSSSPVGPSTAPASSPVALACPHCGAANAADNLFCESCGYDFTTGQAPDPPPVEPPVVIAADPVAAAAGTAADPVAADPALVVTPVGPPAASTWIVVIEVDPAWFALKGELSDQPCPPASTSTVTLARAVSLIGRTSQSRGLRPELALDGDTAVSRRHAQLVVEGEELSVIDLSSTNGTYVVAPTDEPSDATTPIATGVATVLHDGDRVYVGAWSRLTVRKG